MMNENVKLYLRHLDVECGYSYHTIKTYALVLGDFLKIIQEKGIKLRQVSKRELGDYVLLLRQRRKNTSKTIRLKLQVIKGFFSFLSEHTKEIKKNPFDRKDFRYKTEQREVDTLSKSQLEALLQSVETERQKALKSLENTAGKSRLLQKRFFARARDMCLLTLLASTGLRLSEALAIKLTDIDLGDKSINIFGKGKKLRKVFFDLPQVEQTLLSYLKQRHALQLEHHYLFVSIKNYFPLGSRGVQKLFKDYLKKAELRSSVSPHTLRHCFATIAIEKGANIKAVSQILGHANCTITIDLYTHLSNEHLRAVMQKCSPLSGEEISIEERIEGRKKYLAFLDKTG